VELLNIKKTIEASQLNSLKEYKNSGVIKYVEVLPGEENTCSACRKLKGKKLLLDDELRNSTLPVKNCTGGYGYCRCCYIPVIEGME